MNQRLATIDIIRGVSIIAMVATHATAYFTKDPLAGGIWYISQFAVAAFIFCSSYLFFKKTTVEDISHFGAYLKKRLPRLLVPYYYFLLFYIPLLAIKGKNMLTMDTVRMMTLTTPTNDLSWLVLLFLTFSFVMPLILWFHEKMKSLFYLYVLAAVGSSAYFLFYPSPVHFKLIMWLPWSTVILAGYLVAKNETNKWLIPPLTMVSLAAFLASFFVLQNAGLSLAQYANKYPPNLYHLSFGLLGTGILYMLSSTFLFTWNPLKKLLVYISLHSYSIYFIHFLIIHIFINFFSTAIHALGWGGFFAVLMIGSLTIQEGINKLFSKSN